MLTSNYELPRNIIHEYAPAVYAKAPHPSRSDRYLFINTDEILSVLRGEGFVPTGVSQQASKTGNTDTATHLVQLRHTSDLGRPAPSVQTLNLIGDHAGRKRWTIRLGRYVFACSNGLFVGPTDAMYTTKHIGDIIDEVLTGTYNVMRVSSKYQDIVERMQNTYLNLRQQYEFASYALELRGKPGEHFSPYDLLSARRDVDKGDSVWKVFNRTQENATQGLRVVTQDGHRHTLQAINAIDRNVDINARLWNKAQRFVRS